MQSEILPARFPAFLLYLAGTIIATYILQPLFGQLWYVFLLILYFRSKDEAFWFAFFLVVSDGFLGFLGTYEAGLSFLPGLPSIDVSQIFILLTLIKASSKPGAPWIFYTGILQLLMVYLVFLIIWSFMIGPPSQLNEFFRIFKLTLPLLLFYSAPRLMRTEYDYRRFFFIIFPVAILALLTQIFNIIYGMGPAEYLGLVEIGRYSEDFSRGGEPLRAFYNTSIVLFSMFGALFYLSKENDKIRIIYLSFVIIVCLTTAFLSATRGWIISFGVVLSLYIFFILKPGLKISLGIFLITAVLFLTGLKITAIRQQVQGSWERISTIEAATAGDLTMRGTNIRLTVRSERVLNKWKENPFFGWGFSDTYFSFGDGHVGNQSILLHSGIVGAALLLAFFMKFNIKLLIAGAGRTGSNRNRSLLVFVVFFLGWFIIHSSSGQQFSFSGYPGSSITMSLFFSYGALSLKTGRPDNVIPPE